MHTSITKEKNELILIFPNRFVKPGETVAEFDKICEVQSDKASVEISSRYAGNIVKLHYGPNEVAKVGFPLVDIETDDEEQEGSSATANTQDRQKASNLEPSAANKQQHNNGHYISSWETPAVRRLLHEYGLNIKDVIGSGKKGQVLKGDVLSLIKSGSLEKKGIVIFSILISSLDR